MQFFSATRPARFIAWRWVCLLAAAAFSCITFSQDTTIATPMSLLELEAKLAGASQVKLSCRLEGRVRATVPERNLVVVEDVSGAVLLELPGSVSKFQVGDGIAIGASQSFFTPTRGGIRLEQVPVVDHYGLHPTTEKSGEVFLDAGLNPIRVDWFNGPTEFSLNLDFEGLGLPRQRVPASRLWHFEDEAKGINPHPGIRYRAYNAIYWPELNEFSELDFTSAGIATNFTTDYRTGDENCGLSFNGLLQIEHAGLYRFHLKSDDGSRLYVGKTSVFCRRVETSSPMPKPETLTHALENRNVSHWIQMEGEVNFESQHGRDLNFEMLTGGDRVPVTVIEGGNFFFTNLLHRRIHVDGICKFSLAGDEKKFVGVFVPGAGLVRVQSSGDDAAGDDSKMTLTTITQVRRLKTADAARHIPARIQGVVIFASPAAMVLEDAGDGVFISNRNGYWPKQPKVGEVWKIEGSTDTGLFSPVITADTSTFVGFAQLPEPIHPTLDQLINGNMDAEYGELQGVVSSLSSNEVVLLTPDGKVSIVGSSDRPMPDLAKLFPEKIPPLGSVVQIRGCFAPLVDINTRQVIPRKTYIYPAQVEVVEALPPDSFQLPTRGPSDLMWFNARALALQRTKLAGQILYSRPGEYLVFDGRNGFRVLAQDASLEAGDLIEAVGFPKLDGPSPTLQEAMVHKGGHAALPGPTLVPPEQLLDRKLDSTLVQINALLVSDTSHQGERVLELQSGSQQFVARMKSLTVVPPLPVGCRMQLTGVYASAYSNRDRADAQIAPFEILINKYADIKVLQRPPWWTVKRIMIALTVVLALLGIMFGWVVLLRRRVEQRTAQLKREIEQRQFVEQRHAVELERTRVARDLHDELGAGLTEVGLLGSLANTPAIEPEAKNRYLDQIAQLARSLVASLDEIVWAVNPHYDSLPSLVSYFSLYAESFLGHAGMNCRLNVAENIPASPLDSKQRYAVFCTFKEALNNVVRHSKATEVSIAFELAEDKFRLSIVDDGCGFDPAPAALGSDGLINLRERMVELGGRCEIKSQRGSGTKVEIFLPLSQNHYGQSSNC